MIVSLSYYGCHATSVSLSLFFRHRDLQNRRPTLMTGKGKGAPKNNGVNGDVSDVFNRARLAGKRPAEEPVFEGDGDLDAEAGRNFLRWE